jgi:hypothetical protein
LDLGFSIFFAPQQLISLERNLLALELQLIVLGRAVIDFPTLTIVLGHQVFQLAILLFKGHDVQMKVLHFLSQRLLDRVGIVELTLLFDCKQKLLLE